jgi:hypothetical protein
MRSQLSNSYVGPGSFSPTRVSNALRSDDIPGARPRPRHGFASKNTQHYGEKLGYNQPYEMIKATSDVAKPSSPSQKKHYGVHFTSEIQQYNLMHVGDQAPRQLHEVDFPRNLSTKDIPGASPKTFHSPGLKNYYMPSRNRSEISSQKDDRNPLEDSLDKFQREKPMMRSSLAIHTNKSGLYDQELPAYKPQNNHYSLSQNNSPLKRGGYYDEEKNNEEGNRQLNQTHQPIQNTHIRQSTEPILNPKFFQDPPQMTQNPQPVQNYQQIVQNQGYQQRPEENANNQPSTEKNPYEPNDLYSFPPQQAKHSRIKSDANDMEKLTQDMIFQQRLLEKKMKDVWKGRAFNIVSNSPSPLYVNKGGNKYGSSIRALDKGQEYDKAPELLNLKGWSAGNQASPRRVREDTFNVSGKQTNPTDFQYSKNLADEQNPRSKKNDFKIY